MKKSLISKIALAIVLVSASTQTFGIGLQDLRNYFATHPKAKTAVTIAATVIPTFVIPAALTYSEMDRIFATE